MKPLVTVVIIDFEDRQMLQYSERLPSGSHYSILDECDSTSKQAMAQYTEGLKAPFWLVTRKQITGYGRRGRAWQMQHGDFAGSLMYEPNVPVEEFGTFSFIVALAVFGALEDLCRTTPLSTNKISLKWPNDILIDGAKTCGMLLELIKKSSKPALCIGIGINVVSHPDNTPYPATSLKMHGLTPSLITLLQLIDEHFHLWVDMWQQRGFHPIREVWCENATGLGEEIIVNLPKGQICGKFEDIDNQGRLILTTEGKTHTISAGDIFFANSD